MDSNPFKNAEYLTKPSGVILMDGQEVAHTRQCCHGGEHFISIKGSGKRRGWCTNCKAITCGRPECDVCVPYEERISLIEGKDRKKNPHAEAIKELERKFPNVLTL